MRVALLIFPHQLFRKHPAITEDAEVYLVEETLFFNQYNFHKKKLVLHRASMKAYADFMEKRKLYVSYIDAKDKRSDVRNLIAWMADKNITTIRFSAVADDWLNKRIHEAADKFNIELKIFDNPGFLNTMEEVRSYFDEKKTYFQTAFYIEQRKRRNILLNAAHQPEGGHWSYDADNRARYPTGKKPPVVEPASENVYIQEAKIYIEKTFPANHGTTDDFLYPVTFDDAEHWLLRFIHERFEHFGIYQDAIVANEHFLHHAVLSPLLNTGLLEPDYVISKVIENAAEYHIPLNSLEGFIRQIMGWREFIRIVYEREGSRQRTINYWGFTRKIPAGFWLGTTGIIPLDNTIRKVLKTGYCHHIERLMIMGNFMVLCEFDPNEVYRWFMEMFIDSYDWVMVPNVYGMTQFADGGMMATKPYISTSNYILKMSDYKKGGWTAVWDGLFWRFLHKQRHFFEKNTRLGMLIKTLDKMPEEKRALHFKNAETFLHNLDHPGLSANKTPELFD